MIDLQQIREFVEHTSSDQIKRAFRVGCCFLWTTIFLPIPKTKVIQEVRQQTLQSQAFRQQYLSEKLWNKDCMGKSKLSKEI
jgi:hypothetical protein